jgi:CMP-N-acetylneuraminic acid synthetase
VLLAGAGANCTEKVFVSTDDAEIAETGLDYGATIIDRPWQLATDTASNGAVVLHALHEIYRTVKAEYVVMLYPTSPLIESRHIDEAYTQLLAMGEMADTISTVHRRNKTSSLNNLYVKIKDDFLFNLWGTHGIPPYFNFNLFDVYETNGAMGIIRVTPDLFDGMPEIREGIDPHVLDLQYAACWARREAKNLANNQIRTLGYVIEESIGWDINYPADLVVAEALLNYRESRREKFYD